MYNRDNNMNTIIKTILVIITFILLMFFIGLINMGEVSDLEVMHSIDCSVAPVKWQNMNCK